MTLVYDHPARGTDAEQEIKVWSPFLQLNLNVCTFAEKRGLQVA